MDFNTKCAVVSSNTCPLPNSNSKRLFMPGFGTRFNDNKKRKLSNGVQHLKKSLTHVSMLEDSDSMIIDAEIDETARRNLFNLAAYNKHHPTVPQPFNLRTDQKPCSKDHFAEERCLNSRPIFKARPMPKFDNPATITRSEKKLTVPQDFGFSTPVHNRHISMGCISSAPMASYDFTPNRSTCESPSFRAKEMPNFSNPFTPKKNNSMTKFETFNLRTEERGSEKKKLFDQQQSYRDLEDESSRQFKAKPLPLFSPPSTKKSDKAPTTPIMFNLSNERRSLEQLASISPLSSQNFKAKPMPDFSQPFFPVNKNAEITSPVDFELYSNRRAEERALFEESIREKERRERLLKDLEEREQRARELHEIQLLRKSTEFKARPLPDFYHTNNENFDPNFKQAFNLQNSYMDTEPSMTQDEEMTDAI